MTSREELRLKAQLQQAQQFAADRKKRRMAANIPANNVIAGEKTTDGKVKAEFADGSTVNAGLLFNASYTQGGVYPAVKRNDGQWFLLNQSHQPIRRVDDEEEVVEEVTPIKILFYNSTDRGLYIGGDREEPTLVFTLPTGAVIEHGKIDSTGPEEDDWIVSLQYITDNSNYYYPDKKITKVFYGSQSLGTDWTSLGEQSVMAARPVGYGFFVSHTKFDQFATGGPPSLNKNFIQPSDETNNVSFLSLNNISWRASNNGRFLIKTNEVIVSGNNESAPNYSIAFNANGTSPSFINGLTEWSYIGENAGANAGDYQKFIRNYFGGGFFTQTIYQRIRYQLYVTGTWELGADPVNCGTVLPNQFNPNEPVPRLHPPVDTGWQVYQTSTVSNPGVPGFDVTSGRECGLFTLREYSRSNYHTREDGHFFVAEYTIAKYYYSDFKYVFSKPGSGVPDLTLSFNPDAGLPVLDASGSSVPSGWSVSLSGTQRSFFIKRGFLIGGGNGTISSFLNWSVNTTYVNGSGFVAVSPFCSKNWSFSANGNPNNPTITGVNYGTALLSFDGGDAVYMQDNVSNVDYQNRLKYFYLKMNLQNFSVINDIEITNTSIKNLLFQITDDSKKYMSLSQNALIYALPRQSNTFDWTQNSSANLTIIDCQGNSLTTESIDYLPITGTVLSASYFPPDESRYVNNLNEE